MRYIHFLFLCVCIICCVQTSSVRAEVPKDSLAQNADDIAHCRRLSLARDFVAKLKAGISRADKYLGLDTRRHVAKNVLPEGEMLIFQPVLERNFRPNGMILGQMHNGKVVLSLTDFADILQLAISIDSDGQKASGWYIRENRPFSLDIAQKEVNTEKGVFKVSDDVFIKDRDIYVPARELAYWLDFEVDVKVDSQEFLLKSDILLPVQEKEERKKNKYVRHETADPGLPLGGKSYTLASVPIVDVTTRSTYNKDRNDDEGEYFHQAYVKTVGDFAGGTLTTQSRIDDNNQLSRIRATYEQDSLEGDLLGALKAKHIEVGDVTTTQTPLGGSVSQELGVRITNTDPIRSFTRARTVISGNATPGWDVELYRRTQFIGIVHVGDDGFYRFEDVTLYSDDNNFRLVFYGLQGERHEEAVYVPYDKDLLSRGEGIYDISVSFDGQNAYVKRNLKSSNEDRGSMNIAAMYEKPLMDGMTGSVGFRSSENASHRDYVGSAGLSWTFKEALINADIGIDDEGEESVEFSVRRDFGEHELNYTSEWSDADFDDDSSSGNNGSTLGNYLSINGPIIMPYDDISSRYSAALTYDIEEDGDSFLSSTFGTNTVYRNVSFSGQLKHATGSTLQDDTLDSVVNLNIRKDKNVLRLATNYDIKPEAKVDSLSASYSRDINDELDIYLSATKDVDTSLVGYQARLDWQAGFIRISPSVSYNTEDDFFAGINTRFGLMREPLSGDIRMYDRTITNNALVSAFVYLDKNGDGNFNGEDEPLPDVVVSAPQNGRIARSNEKGIALFERMTNLRLTDVYVDKESLQDPAWIPGFEGVSILPRKGYVAQVEFPVHMSGELDGTVYANVVPLPDEIVAEIEPVSGVAPEEGEDEEFDALLKTYGEEPAKTGHKNFVQARAQPVPLRNIELQLYSDKGEIEQSVMTDIDGFYFFTNIPPGRYFLMIDEKSAQRKNVIRPKPQPVEITYEGTLIYDHKIFVDTGAGDVPSEIMADLKSYKERHPHVHFDDEKSDLVLNLGAYNSRLLMTLVWYKLRTRFGQILGEFSQPLVPPAESYADTKTGKHILRVAIDSKTLDEAYIMCRSFMVRDQYCKVEIFPSYINEAYIKQAMAISEPVDITEDAEKQVR